MRTRAQGARQHSEGANTATAQAPRGHAHSEDASRTRTRAPRRSEHSEDASRASTRAHASREHSENASTARTRAPRGRARAPLRARARVYLLPRACLCVLARTQACVFVRARGRVRTSVRLRGGKARKGEEAGGGGTLKSCELQKFPRFQISPISFGFCILPRLSPLEKTKRVDGGSSKAANLKNFHAFKSLRSLSDLVYCRASPHSKKLSGWTGGAQRLRT